MFNAVISTVPHREQRYDTVGDYYTAPNDTTVFRISDLSNWKMEFLIALHEMIEFAITQHCGIPIHEIDEFDKLCLRSGLKGEPGDNPKAPYYRAHQIATFVERAMASELGIDWAEYEKRIEELSYVK